MSTAGKRPNGRVLIVDRSDESRDVLRTVLERRGLQTYEARGARRGLELAHRHQPDLIVLDMEAVPGDDEAVCDGFDAQSRDGRTSLVVLGNARQSAPAVWSGQFVTKPYHYAPLVRRIEELLDQSLAGYRS